MTPTLVLPIGPINIAILALLALMFVSIAGVLPLGPAALAVPGLAVGALALAVPRLALALLIVSIPFSSWTKVTLGTFDVTATDALVGALALGWLLPGLISPLRFLTPCSRGHGRSGEYPYALRAQSRLPVFPWKRVRRPKEPPGRDLETRIATPIPGCRCGRVYSGFCATV